MTKQVFLNALRGELSGLSEEDIERSLTYFSEAIDDRIEDGMTEEDAVAEMGTVKNAAAGVFADVQREAKRSEPRTYQPGNESVRVTDAFKHIRIEDSECDIDLLPSADGGCCVEYIDCGSIRHECCVENETLMIRSFDERRWFEKLGMRNHKMRVAVYMPATGYETLFITTASGDINIAEGFAFLNAEIKTASGDIELSVYAEDSLSMHSASGDIAASVQGPGSVKANSMSGDVQIIGKTGEGDVSAESKSGDIKIKSVSCGTFTAHTLSGDADIAEVDCLAANIKSVSGDVSAKQLISIGELNAESVSGDVTLTHCDGANMLLKTVSGDIAAQLESSKYFVTSTISGHMNVPQTCGEGKCEVKTVSGSARITVK